MPYIDRPLPADFEVPAIAPLRHKPPRKRKGQVAKVTRDLKQGILNGAIAHGYDGEGEGGLDGYLAMCAEKYPKHYMNLLGKLVPMQLNTDVSGQRIGSINIVSIPSNHFLSAEDIARMRVSPPLLEHEHERPYDALSTKVEIADEPEFDAAAEPEPEFVPRSPREAQMFAKLSAMSHDELLRLAKQVGLVDADQE